MSYRLFSFSVLFFLWGTALAGFLKYLGIVTGVPYFHLVPKAILFALIFVPFILWRVSVRQFLYFFLIFIWCGYSLLRNGLPQTLMGVWVILPFIFGALYPSEVLAQEVIKNLKYIWLVSLFGVFVNKVYQYPWESMAIDYGDYTSNVARAWSDDGVSRLAGLTSSSIDLSLILAISSYFIIGNTTDIRKRFLIIAVSVVGMLMTTMKTAAAAYVFTIFPLVIRAGIVRTLWVSVSLGVGLVAAFIPFYSYINAIGKYASVADGYSSLFTRVDVVWPAVVDFIVRHDPGFLGLGIGGLGASMSFGKEYFPFAFVDNMYLYVLGVAGFLGLCFLILLFWSGIRWIWSSRDDPNYVGKGLLVFFMVYGSTQVGLETSFGAIFLGAVFSSSIYSVSEKLVYISTKYRQRFGM